jgi:hypothetical protein
MEFSCLANFFLFSDSQLTWFCDVDNGFSRPLDGLVRLKFLNLNPLISERTRVLLSSVQHGDHGKTSHIFLS